MADIKKVIQALEECAKYGYHCDKCPYKPTDDETYCNTKLARDAVELLKEQQNRIEVLRSEVKRLDVDIVRCKDCKHWSKDEKEDFKDINGAYNNCNMHDDLSHMLDELLKEQEWIPISERLPENAEHPGAFCPKVRVLTVWGESYGWYNPDIKAWYFLVWYMDYSMTHIDFEHGDVPGVSYTPKGTKMITHWKPIA